MRRRSFVATVLCLAVSPFVASGALGQGKGKKSTLTRVSGRVERVLKDSSTIMIRKDTRSMNILYDASTLFTFRNKPGSLDEVKEGRRVICLVKENDKKQMVASRVDVREK